MCLEVHSVVQLVRTKGTLSSRRSGQVESEETGKPRFAYDYRRSATYTSLTYLHFRSGVLPHDVTILVRELFPRGFVLTNEPCRPTLLRRHFRLGRLNKPWCFMRDNGSGMDS